MTTPIPIDLQIAIAAFGCDVKPSERCGARTPFDLAAVDELWRGLELAINWGETVNKILAGERGVPIRRPKAIPLAGGQGVFEWDSTRNGSTLVVTTILYADMPV